jgi:streptomycin 3"-kinase
MTHLDKPGWIAIRDGESGDAVYRREDGAAFAKFAAQHRRAELEGERDRLLWLEEKGIACPRVLDWRDAEAMLVTSAMPGVPADKLSGDDLATAWPSIAEAVGALHRLEARGCPFERGLRKMLAQAGDVVARGAVNPDFLCDEDRSMPLSMLLARLESEVSVRMEDEARELVVCHGDATMPNLMVDPVTLRCTGVVDLGRMGTADPYVDFSLMLANSDEVWTSGAQARYAFDTLFSILGVNNPDRRRLDFYLRLDPLTWG